MITTNPKALALISSRGANSAGDAAGDIVRQQREELARKTDVSMVVDGKRGWNPFSKYAQTRRAAEDAALTTRLETFREQLLAVRKTNEVMSRGAIAEVAMAVEDYLTRIQSESVANKSRSRQEARLKLKKVFTDRLVDLQVEAERKIINPDMLEAMVESAYMEFAEESARLGKINVEFDKSQLLSVTFDPSR
jgi:F0F1-type ATP synthase gamma subunit